MRLVLFWQAPPARPYSMAQLRQVQQEMVGAFPRLHGLDVFSSGVDAVTAVVDVGVLVVTPGAQSAVDRQFGVGVVALTGALRPVS